LEHVLLSWQWLYTIPIDTDTEKNTLREERNEQMIVTATESTNI
jgi:hypothetical protein